MDGVEGEVSKFRKLLAYFGYSTRPDFMIIGAQKAGTTALFQMLEQHSQILGASKKEIHYFDNNGRYSKQKIHQYHRYFPLPIPSSQGKRIFEATPKYLFHPDVAKRLYRYNPKLKLLLVLREPAERAFSHWTMCHNKFKSGPKQCLHDERSFSEAIYSEINDINNGSYIDKKSYVGRGLYAEQLARYTGLFPNDNLLIIESQELKNDHFEVMDKIMTFLEVSKEDLKPILTHERQVNEAEQYTNEINFLREFYQPHNEHLFKLMGKDYPSWGLDIRSR